MAVIQQAHEQLVRSRYRQAALAYLVLGLAVMGLTHLPGMEKVVPTPFLSDWRVPVAVFAMFVATALIYGAHRVFTLFVALFVLYRGVVLALGAIAARHLELRPDPSVVLPETWTDPAALQALVQGEMASATPLYELAHVQAGNASLPATVGAALGNPSFSTTMVAWVCVGLLVIVLLLLFRAARLAP